MAFTSHRVILHIDLDCFYCKPLHLELAFDADSSALHCRCDSAAAWLHILRLPEQSSGTSAGQVEQKRLNIPRSTPVAVQQWEGLIAINYACRAAGITRHMRVGEATKICPDLQAVHVQTLGTSLRLLHCKQFRGELPASRDRPCFTAEHAGTRPVSQDGLLHDHVNYLTPRWLSR